MINCATIIILLKTSIMETSSYVIGVFIYDVGCEYKIINLKTFNVNFRNVFLILNFFNLYFKGNK